MTGTFADLPDDVLLDIFQHLSVNELVFFAQTCKRALELTKQRSVWIGKLADHRAQFPAEDSSHILTEDLKRKVVNEFMIDTLWQSNITRPRQFTVTEHPGIVSVNLLPGAGGHLFIVYEDNKVCIRPILNSNQVDFERGRLLDLPSACPITGLNMRFWDYAVLPLSEMSGSLVLHLSDGVDNQHNHRHVFLFEYRISSEDVRLDITGHVIFNDTRRLVHDWARSGPMFGALFTLRFDTNYYLSYFKTPSSPEPASISEALFKIGSADFGPGSSSDEHPSYLTLAMVSPHCVVLAGGTDCICVYNIPSELECTSDASVDSSILLQAVWRWNSHLSNYSVRRFLCSGVFVENFRPSVPIIYIHTGSDVIHRLEFDLSSLENPVQKHCEFIVPYKTCVMIYLGTRRACLAAVDEELGSDLGTGVQSMRLITLTLSDSIQIGSFVVPFGMSTIYFSVISVDEVSGRICLMPSNQPKSVLWIG